MVHFVIVGILVILMTVLTYFGLDALGLAQQMHPVAASAQAVPIDQLWHWEVMVISFLFALIVVPIIYSLVAFRQKKGELKDGLHIEGNTNLEIAWTVVPLLIVVVFAYLGAYSLGEVRRVDPNAMVINVKGQQFSWTFEYPEYGFITTELYLPVDRQVVLKMESADVIHSFWVPQLAGKTDLIPGRTNRMWLEAAEAGTYHGQCAEFCGLGHALMRFTVEAQTQADFDAWVNEQKNPTAGGGGQQVRAGDGRDDDQAAGGGPGATFGDGLHHRERQGAGGVDPAGGVEVERAGPGVVAADAAQAAGAAHTGAAEGIL